MFAPKEIEKQTKVIAPTLKREAPRNRADTKRWGDNSSDSTYLQQRYLGNSYLQSMAGGLQTQGVATCTPAIQAKLTIGPTDDVYEQEADAVADEVMRMPEPAVQRQSS